MIGRIAGALSATLLVVALSCGGARILNPATGPGTSYPCGVRGVSCPEHMCCPEDNVCGGGAFSGCPIDMCCYAPSGGETWTGASQPTPQTPEQK